MKIVEIQLLTSKIAATKVFYENILGLELKECSKSKISFKAGHSLLSFISTEVEHPFYHFAFTIPKNQLEVAFSYMDSRLEILPVEPAARRIADFKNWNAKAFYFRDNNDNIVEFIARYALNNADQKPFDGPSIYSISEIGIVVDSVTDYVKELLNNFNIRIFSRQPPQDHFTVMGTDEGLFIIVKKERAWYPTNQKAQPFRTKIIFEDDHGQTQEIVLHPER